MLSRKQNSLVQAALTALPELIRGGSGGELSPVWCSVWVWEKGQEESERRLPIKSKTSGGKWLCLWRSVHNLLHYRQTTLRFLLSSRRGSCLNSSETGGHWFISLWLNLSWNDNNKLWSLGYCSSLPKVLSLVCLRMMHMWPITAGFLAVGFPQQFCHWRHLHCFWPNTVHQWKKGIILCSMLESYHRCLIVSSAADLVCVFHNTNLVNDF